MKKEKFYTIPGFSDYQISKKGNVKSVRSDKILKPLNDWLGYYFVSLYKNKIKHNIKIHKLMQLTFFDNQKLRMDHKKGIKKDNRLKSL